MIAPMVERHQLLEAARLCDWPAAPEFGLGEGGEPAWAIATPTPQERIRLMAALSCHLTARPPGDRHLEHAAPPPAETPPARRRRFRETLYHVGDLEVLDVLLDLLLVLPPPVAEHVAATVAFVSGGWSTEAYTTGPLVTDGRERMVWISAHHRNPVRLAFVLAHEIAHCWTRAPRPAAEPPVPATTTIARENVETLFRAEAPEALASIDPREQLADLLALSWLASAAIAQGDHP